MRSSTIRGRAAAAIFALGCAVVLGVSLHVHFKPYAYEPEPVGVDPDWYSPSEELASAGQYGMGFLNHDCAGADPEVVDREAARALELLERYSDDEILRERAAGLLGCEAFALRTTGDASASLGHALAARELYGDVLETEPGATRAVEGLMTLLIEYFRDVPAAVRVFEESPDDVADDLDVLLIHGRLLSRAGAWEPAEKALRRLWEQSKKADGPKYQLLAKEYLGRLALDRRDLDEARKLLTEAAEGATKLDLGDYKRENVYWGCPYQALGELYGVLGHGGSMVENLVRTAEIEDDFRSQFDAAVGSYAVGDVEGARRYLSAARQRSGHPEIATLDRLLAEHAVAPKSPARLALDAALIHERYLVPDP